MTSVIEAIGLRVRLGGHTILRGITLTVASGDVVALLGANGSGKSTLVRTLVGAIPASAGHLTLFGQRIGPRAPWHRIGYVPQRVSAASGTSSTALEVVSSGLLHQRRLRLPRDWRVQAYRALEQVGMSDHATACIAELSGGQQQRVLIARALVRKPDILILDEPVAGVDAPSQEALSTTLRELIAEGLTVLIVLHEIGVLAPLITRAVVLRHGVIVHDGAPPPATGFHAVPGHDHIHPHESPEPEPRTSTGLNPGLADTHRGHDG